MSIAAIWTGAISRSRPVSSSHSVTPIVSRQGLASTGHTAAFITRGYERTIESHSPWKSAIANGASPIEIVIIIVASTAGNRFRSDLNAASRNTGTIATIVVRASTSRPTINAAVTHRARVIENASARKTGQYTGVWPINVNRWTSSARISAA